MEEDWMGVGQRGRGREDWEERREGKLKSHKKKRLVVFKKEHRRMVWPEWRGKEVSWVRQVL